MKNHIVLIIVAFLCFATCKKENKNENLCYSPTLISQINSGDLAVHGLTYNINCLIYESTQPYMYKRYTYGVQNTLTKVEVAYSFSPFSCVMIPGQSTETDPRKASVSEYSEFKYDDAVRLITKLNYFISNGNSELINYQTYDYENNKIVKRSSFNAQGVLYEYHDYQYDGNENLIRDDHYSNYSDVKLNETRIYEFDNKNNPYRVFASEGNPGINSNKNNILKETCISYEGTAESQSTKQYVYEYNGLDYPVKINDMDCIYGK